MASSNDLNFKSPNILSKSISSATWCFSIKQQIASPFKKRASPNAPDQMQHKNPNTKENIFTLIKTGF